MKKQLTVLSILSISFVFLSLLNTRAQAEPQFLITWKTQTYTPAAFTGKVLAGASSPLTVAFEIIENGKLVDLSRQTIYWYLDNNFVRGGEGVQSLSIIADKRAAGGSQALRIQLPSFRGNLLIKAVDVPIVRPEVVVEAPFPQGKISGAQVKLFGQPYFFNVKSLADLNFSWTAAGQSPANSNEPENLVINLGENIPSGTSFSVNLSIRNPNNIFEAAAKTINLVFSP